jgi:hypothetical protein
MLHPWQNKAPSAATVRMIWWQLRKWQNITTHQFSIDATGEVFNLSDDSGLVLLNFLRLKSHVSTAFHLNCKDF